jgi:hypothetical protein
MKAATKKRNAGRAPGGFDRASLQAKPKQTSHRQREQPERPYSIIILAGAKSGSWGSYSTIEEAAAVAQKLRQLGMHAVVEGEGVQR